MAVDVTDLVDFSAREVPSVKVTATTREEYFGAVGGEEGGCGKRSAA